MENPSSLVGQSKDVVFTTLQHLYRMDRDAGSSPALGAKNIAHE